MWKEGKDVLLQSECEHVIEQAFNLNSFFFFKEKFINLEEFVQLL